MLRVIANMEDFPAVSIPAEALREKLLKVVNEKFDGSMRDFWRYIQGR